MNEYTLSLGNLINDLGFAKIGPYPVSLRHFGFTSPALRCCWFLAESIQVGATKLKQPLADLDALRKLLKETS